MNIYKFETILVMINSLFQMAAGSTFGGLKL